MSDIFKIFGGAMAPAAHPVGDWKGVKVGATINPVVKGTFWGGCATANPNGYLYEHMQNLTTITVVLVAADSGKVLLLRKKRSGKWVLPGECQEQESEMQGVARCLYEEVGFTGNMPPLPRTSESFPSFKEMHCRFIDLHARSGGEPAKVIKSKLALQGVYSIPMQDPTKKDVHVVDKVYVLQINGSFADFDFTSSIVDTKEISEARWFDVRDALQNGSIASFFHFPHHKHILSDFVNCEFSGHDILPLSFYFKEEVTHVARQLKNAAGKSIRVVGDRRILIERVIAELQLRVAADIGRNLFTSVICYEGKENEATQSDAVVTIETQSVPVSPRVNLEMHAFYLTNELERAFRAVVLESDD